MSEISNNETKIHPTAIIEKGAEIGVGVEIGPYSIIGANVKIGDGCKLHSHVVVQGHTTLGKENKIWPFASIGTTPQDLKFKGEIATLSIGERNMFREYSNVSIGTADGGYKTVVGSDNLFMMNVHVAHDCIIGSHCIFANGVSLAGHIEVADGAVFGGHSAAHQFVKVGQLAMIAAGSIVVQDVPAFVTVYGGEHAKPTGLNLLGLRRSGRNKDDISNIKKMYQLLYNEGLSFDDAIKDISNQFETEDGKAFVNLLKSSTRGVCR